MKWNGSAWSLVGSGALNPSGGWAAHPWLATDGTSLYLAFELQAKLGAYSKGYVFKFDGAAWTQLGVDLNADHNVGSVNDIVLAYVPGTSTLRAVWGETTEGSLQQIYQASWNGTNWSTSPSAPVSPGLAPAPAAIFAKLVLQK